MSGFPPIAGTRFTSFFDTRPQRTTFRLEDFQKYIVAVGMDASPKAKRKYAAWSPALYPEGATTKKQDGITGVTALVLDYDDGTTLDHLAELWAEWCFVAYSSWSHTPAAPRFRVVLPLSRTATPEEHKATWAWARTHSPTIDSNCADVGRIYGLPVQRPDADPPEFWYNPGKLLTPHHAAPTRTARSTAAAPAPDGVLARVQAELARVAREANAPKEVYAELVEGCGFMKLAEDEAATLPEPLWYAWLSILARCRDGAEAAHQVGSRHPGYTYAETEEKFARAGACGPRTCENVASLMDANQKRKSCQKCPLNGKITSPVQAGSAPAATTSISTPTVSSSEASDSGPERRPDNSCSASSGWRTNPEGASSNRSTSTTGSSMPPAPSPSESAPASTAFTGASAWSGSATTSSPSTTSDTPTGRETPSSKATSVPTSAGDGSDGIMEAVNLNVKDSIQRHKDVQGEMAALQEALVKAVIAQKSLKDQQRREKKGAFELGDLVELNTAAAEADALVAGIREQVKRKKEELERASAAVAKAKQIEDNPPGTDPATWAQLRRGDKGGPLSSLENVHIILNNDPAYAGHIWLDEFSMTPYHGERPFEDATDARIMLDIQQRYQLYPKKEAITDAVLLTADGKRRHPVREYLNSLPTWDGQKRAGRLLFDGFGASEGQDTRLLERIGEMFLVALVRRIFVPGDKSDNMLVLTGRQRRYKSSALAALVSPPEAARYGGWFSDETIDLQDKDGKMLLLGKWLIEIGELDSFRGKAHAAIKAFMSRKEDRFRPPYGRRPITQPRQCLFAGTTNEDEFLSDSTGNLRYYCVHIEQADLAWIEQNRTQLWAEAVALYRAGAKHYFDADEDKEALAKQNRRFEQVHPWQQQVEAFVRRSKVPTLTVLDAMTKVLELPVHQQNHQQKVQVVAILRALGFEPPDGSRESGKDYAWRTPQALLGDRGLKVVEGGAPWEQKKVGEK